MPAAEVVVAQNLIVTGTTARWRWKLLYDALVALAAEPAEQLAGLGGAHIDDLGLDFDNAKGVVDTLREDGVVFSAEAVELLETIDAELFIMSDGNHGHLWNAESLATAEQWALIRGLARSTIEHLPACPD